MRPRAAGARGHALCGRALAPERRSDRRVGGGYGLKNRKTIESRSSLMGWARGPSIRLRVLPRKLPAKIPDRLAFCRLVSNGHPGGGDFAARLWDVLGTGVGTPGLSGFHEGPVNGVVTLSLWSSPRDGFRRFITGRDGSLFYTPGLEPFDPGVHPRSGLMRGMEGRGWPGKFATGRLGDRSIPISGSTDGSSPNGGSPMGKRSPHLDYSEHFSRIVFYPLGGGS